MVQRARIGKTDIAALQPNQTIWDTKVVGFGARRQRSAAITYFYMYRSKEGVQRRLTIGRHGPLTPDQARDKAKALQGKLVEGADPAKDKAAEAMALTVAQACDAYLEDSRSGRLLKRNGKSRKASTIATDAGRVERHIKPLLGSRKLSAVTREDVERFLHDVAEGKTATRTKSGRPRGVVHVRGGKGTATRTLALLGSIFSQAVRRGFRADNPVAGVTPYAYSKRERRLTDAENVAFGAAIAAAKRDGLWPPATAAAEFLLVTGWRRGEVLGLRRSELDLTRRTAILADTKTGRSLRPLSEAACEIIRAQPTEGEYVFAAARGNGPMSGFPSYWRKMMSGHLPADITPHTLRHSFASLASDLGYSESTIAALIGHARHSVTSRYVHSADAVLLAAADAIAEEICERSAPGRVQADVR